MRTDVRNNDVRNDVRNNDVRNNDVRNNDDRNKPVQTFSPSTHTTVHTPPLTPALPVANNNQLDRKNLALIRSQRRNEHKRIRKLL